MNDRRFGSRWRVALVLVVGLVAAGGLVACGGDDESSEDVEARIAAEREDAAQQARQQQRIKQLEKDLEDAGEADAGSTTPAPAEVPADSEFAPRSFKTYSSVQGGWQAEVPTGGGWSEGVDTQVNAGLFRTTFTGPAGAVLIVDSTPNEAPTYSGDVSRTPVSHPIFTGVEKLVFRGNTSVSPCETSVCVDFLMPSGGGGYAVLAGGPGSFPELESIAETTMLSLSPFDI